MSAAPPAGAVLVTGASTGIGRAAAERLARAGTPVLAGVRKDADAQAVGAIPGIEPVIRDGVIYSVGNTILGGDDKSGVAAILEVLQTLREQDLAHPPLEVVISVGEELGLELVELDRAVHFRLHVGHVTLRLAEEVPHGAGDLRQLLRTDDDERHGADQRDLVETEVDHGRK